MIGAEITIAGPRPLRGTVRVPGDKGISHRALLSAALAYGRSTIRSLADGDDVQRTRAALEQLGVRVKDSEPSTVTVLGTGAALCHSGSPLRRHRHVNVFTTPPVIAALATTVSGTMPSEGA